MRKQLELWSSSGMCRMTVIDGRTVTTWPTCPCGEPLTPYYSPSACPRDPWSWACPVCDRSYSWAEITA